MQINLFSQQNQFKKQINQINLFEDYLKLLSDNELQEKIQKLKIKYKKIQDLNQVLIDSFALTREVSLRTLGLRHFDVQLFGGLVLNDHKIAEIQTGEGKTLVATLPASLNALTQKGVHIVTVNDYLAKRDQINMSPIYRFLGFDTGLIQENSSRVERKKNYQADITYVTHNELAFDFLRDNLAFNVSDVVLRPFNYCILDEVDSILIDEAQTPLIISNKGSTLFNKYIIAAELINYLIPNLHYSINEEENSVILTDSGNRQVEQILQIQNLYDPKDPWIPYIINALKANSLFFKNIHYVINENKINIVDDSTGRIMFDRQWENGLHQAIEAKEGLKIQYKQEPVASITYQKFFLLYPKLSGMSGTGLTANFEFKKIYGLSVEQVPPARLNLRKDLPDLIYKTQNDKWAAIIDICKKIHSTGQPILIGTTTIKKSEKLAQLLETSKLPYNLLNAKPKNARLESQIISQAGKRNAITIATNMAGRGTDILLGGNFTLKIQKKLYLFLIFLKRNSSKSVNYLIKSNLFNSYSNLISQKSLNILLLLITNNEFLNLSDLDILNILKGKQIKVVLKKIIYTSILSLKKEWEECYQKYQKQEKNFIKTLGGLFIIGTERNSSYRIDNQLRGRSARQGDPGSSHFFISLEDKLLRVSGQTYGIKTQNKKDLFPLNSKVLTKSLNLIQNHVEKGEYKQRKNLVVYDEILNKQRNLIYIERKQILEDNLLYQKILTLMELFITDLLFILKKEKKSNTEILLIIENLFGKNLALRYMRENAIDKFNFIELKTYLFNEFWLAYKSKINEVSIYGNGIHENLERSLLLVNMDKIWQEHLQKMLILQETIEWQKYKKGNFLIEYNANAFNLFNLCYKFWYHLVIYDLLHLFIFE